MDIRNNNLEGKLLCFLGDSITDGVGVKKGERYFDILGRELSCNAIGYGVNGARFAGLTEQVSRMEGEQGEKPDAVFVFAGTNDFNGSIPLGSWYTETAETVVATTDESCEPATYKELRRRDFCFDTSTFRGSINCVLSKLKQSCATGQVVLMTPIHRAYACFGPTNIQYPENYSNTLGLFIDDYVNVVREAAGIWSCELIDLWQVSGLLPIYDESAAENFMNIEHDRLHPNKNGHKRIAEVIKAKLNSIPIFDNAHRI